VTKLSEFDQKRLLMAISEGRLTRADLAKEVGRGIYATITALTNLVELGLIVEHKTKRPIFYSLTPSGVKAVQQQRRRGVFLKFKFQEVGYGKTNNPTN